MSNSHKEMGTRSGAVPTVQDDPPTVWAGHGSGELCAYCYQPISASEIEYEVLDPTHLGSGHLLKFHIGCHASWRATQGVPG
jgi:hypothetical protein